MFKVTAVKYDNTSIMEEITMKKNIIFWFFTIFFFVIYWRILALIWNLWVPFNIIIDILSMFIVVVVNIPLSAISAEQTVKIIKGS